jgi:hypothetical protein
MVTISDRFRRETDAEHWEQRANRGLSAGIAGSGPTFIVLPAAQIESIARTSEKITFDLSIMLARPWS